jgi:hypothetical protein
MSSLGAADLLQDRGRCGRIRCGIYANNRKAQCDAIHLKSSSLVKSCDPVPISMVAIRQSTADTANPAGAGWPNFNYYCFAQVGKEVSVIHERFKGGGSGDGNAQEEPGARHKHLAYPDRRNPMPRSSGAEFSQQAGETAVVH